MKVDMSKYVASCGVCQRVKAEHKSLAGKLQSLEVPLWPWDDIAMDFVVGLPRSPKGRDTIWVVVDRLSKVAHFIPIWSTNSAGDLAPIYMRDVVRLHGVPRTIVLDRDTKFFFKVVGYFTRSIGHCIENEHHFSPSNGWTIRAYDPDPRRYALIMCAFLEG